jgi:hypothetical protein
MISPILWVENLGGRRSGNRHGLGLALGQDVASPHIRPRILDLGPAIAADAIAELEQSGVEL